jgi:hypothetical protein
MKMKRSRFPRLISQIVINQLSGLSVPEVYRYKGALSRRGGCLKCKARTWRNGHMAKLAKMCYYFKTCT